MARSCSAHWDGLLSHYVLESSDEKLNRMVNIWNPYQCMVTFNMSRSASYFETGIGRGMGFRDSNQDLLGFVHHDPGARPRAHHRHCLDAVRRRQRVPPVPAAHQARQQRHRQRLQRRPALAHLRRRRPTSRRLATTASSTSRCRSTTTRSNKATLFEHLKRSFDHVLNNLGPHGLPLIGRADWNDCLNLNCFSETPDESFQTTGNATAAPRSRSSSPACSWASAPEYANLCEHARLTSAEAEARGEAVAKMEKPCCSTAGTASGSCAPMTSSATRSAARSARRPNLHRAAGLLRHGRHRRRRRARRRRRSTRSRSAWTPSTASCCNKPAYHEYHVELGEISSYPPGYKENAGIFCHNNPWIIIAETMIGRGDRAFDY